MLQHLVKIVAACVMLAVLVLLVQCNGLARDLTELFAPGWGRIAWLVCGGLELVALVWLGLACFARPSRLLLREDPSEAERQAFAAEQRAAGGYRAVAAETADPALRALYEELSGDEARHAGLLLALLERL